MIYFASDVHLGLNFGEKTPLEREKFFVNFLSQIQNDCEELFLLGDIFDFWFEWKRVVPRGYMRVLGKLSQMCDQGIKVHFFAGNHDLWLNDYLEKEVGMIIHHQPYITERQGKMLFLAHGDTFYKYKPVGKFLSTLFRSNWARQVAQRVIHPDAMIRFGMNWSLSNRKKRGGVAHIFSGEEDYLVKYCREYLAQNSDQKIDFFVFGHLHTPIEYALNEFSTMVVLGEWVDSPFYGAMNGGRLELRRAN